MKPRFFRSGYQCPKCHDPGRWRSGVGFEHEKRCGTCNIVWEPERTMVEWNGKFIDLADKEGMTIRIGSSDFKVPRPNEIYQGADSI